MDTTGMKTLEDIQKEDALKNPGESLEDKVISLIRAHRINQGVSQKKLAELTGVSRSQISRMENGLAKPPLKTLGTLAEALNLSIQFEVRPL